MESDRGRPWRWRARLSRQRRPRARRRRKAAPGRQPRPLGGGAAALAGSLGRQAVPIRAAVNKVAATRAVTRRPRGKGVGTDEQGSIGQPLILSDGLRHPRVTRRARSEKRGRPLRTGGPRRWCRECRHLDSHCRSGTDLASGPRPGRCPPPGRDGPARIGGWRGSNGRPLPEPVAIAVPESVAGRRERGRPAPRRPATGDPRRACRRQRP